MHPRRLVFAVPVCAEDSADRLAPLADELICLSSPEPFGAVGNWYETFDQTTDEEVLRIVTRSRAANG
jgi:putative phosphoribosyl transferase